MSTITVKAVYSALHDPDSWKFTQVTNPSSASNHYWCQEFKKAKVDQERLFTG